MAKTSAIDQESAMPAIILQNPRSPVTLQDPDDLPVTAESVRDAIDASNAERQRIAQETGIVIPLHPMPETAEPVDPRRY